MESKDTSRDTNPSDETNQPLVVGLFPRGEDAQLAITDLCNNGLRTRQIGAAFRSAIRNVDPGVPPAASSRPMGRRELSSDFDRVPHQEIGRWWDRLKSAFREDDRGEDARPAASRFGERPGELPNSSAAPSSTAGPSPLDPGCSGIENWTYDCDYAQGDFEECLTELGLPQERARILKLSLAPGGAIVMVRTIDSARVEHILERHNGRIQHETRPRREPGRTLLESYPPIAGTVAINRTSEPSGSHLVPEYPSENNSEQALKRESRPSRRTNDRIQLFGEVLQVQKERMNCGELRAANSRKDAGNVSLPGNEPKNDTTLRRPA